jgi:RimJ/RimL family protein N-acetyltransferase
MNEEYNFRMLAFSDYQAFKETCSVSQKELTMYLDLGKYMEYFMISDYWNFFYYLLKDPETNTYGLFEGKKLLGLAMVSPSKKSFGSQIVGFIKHGHHGQGLASLYLSKLIDRCFRNGNHFVEFVIDQANKPSKRVAEKVGLIKIQEWENFGSGQGTENSGKFVSYYAFDTDIRNMANRLSVEPYLLIQQLWILESRGLIEKPEMVLRHSSNGHTRISQTLRLVGTEKHPHVNEADSHETTLR